MSQRALALSLLLHLSVFLLSYLGASIFSFRDPLPQEPLAISVELLPVSEISNVKPSKKPLSKAPPPKKELRKAKPKTTKKETIEVEPIKPVEAVKMPAEEKKQEDKPKEDAKKKRKDDFDAVLQSVEENTPTAEETPEEKPKEDGTDGATSRSDTYDDSIPLSISEKDAIIGQVARHWRMPVGAKNDYDLAVKIQVLLFPDGSVQDVGLARGQESRYQNDPFFRSAVDSAIRAVWAVSQFKGLPPDKYDSWRDMELNFDPRELLY